MLLAVSCTVPGTRGEIGRSATGRASPGPSGTPVRIGLVTGLTGPAAQLGQAQRNAAELTVKELGGRAGAHAVSVVVKDDQGRPDAALAAARDLVATDHVDFLAGCVSSATALAVNQVAREAGVPYLGTCQAERLSRPPDLGPATFPLVPPPSAQVRALTPWVLATLGRRLLFLEPDEPWGHDQYEAFRQAVPAGGGLLGGVIWQPVGTADFTSYVPRIQAARPDVVVLGTVGRDQVRFLQQAHQFGLDRQAKIFVFVTDAALDEETGFDALAGTYGAANFLWTGAGPAAQRFVSDYQAAYGRPPGGYAAAAHDAVMLVARQVEADGYRPAQFAAALSGTTMDLSGGRELIRACDRQAFPPTYVVQGLAAAEAASRGGSARHGYRVAVATIPPAENLAPACP